jgi:predicted transcriptional regulator
MEEQVSREQINNDKWHNIKCCYRLSETEISCFIKLLELNRPITSIELAGLMKFSKTTVETALRKLTDVGLVTRQKLEGARIGRPKYVYSLPEYVWGKIEKDLNKCGENMKNTKL